MEIEKNHNEIQDSFVGDSVSNSENSETSKVHETASPIDPNVSSLNEDNSIGEQPVSSEVLEPKASGNEKQDSFAQRSDTETADSGAEVFSSVSITRSEENDKVSASDVNSDLNATNSKQVEEGTEDPVITEDGYGENQNSRLPEAEINLSSAGEETNETNTNTPNVETESKSIPDQKLNPEVEISNLSTESKAIPDTTSESEREIYSDTDSEPMSEIYSDTTSESEREIYSDTTPNGSSEPNSNTENVFNPGSQLNVNNFIPKKPVAQNNSATRLKKPTVSKSNCSGWYNLGGCV
jgi:hypothetical protein